MTRPIPLLFPPKSVNSVLDYGLDWSQWLGHGDHIVSYDITATPPGLTISSPVLTKMQGEVIVSSFIAGGAPSTSYLIKLSVTTARGLTDIESAVLNVLPY